MNIGTIIVSRNCDQSRVVYHNSLAIYVKSSVRQYNIFVCISAEPWYQAFYVFLLWYLWLRTRPLSLKTITNAIYLWIFTEKRKKVWCVCVVVCGCYSVIKYKLFLFLFYVEVPLHWINQSSISVRQKVSGEQIAIHGKPGSWPHMAGLKVVPLNGWKISSKVNYLFIKHHSIDYDDV